MLLFLFDSLVASLFNYFLVTSLNFLFFNYSFCLIFCLSEPAYARFFVMSVF